MANLQNHEKQEIISLSPSVRGGIFSPIAVVMQCVKTTSICFFAHIASLPRVSMGSALGVTQGSRLIEQPPSQTLP